MECLNATLEADDPIYEWARKVRENDARREAERQRNEPLPETLFPNTNYTTLVADMKRFAIEFDEIEQNYTREKHAELRGRVRAVGKELHALGGNWLMRLTLDTYVCKTGGMHRCFDGAFDGIGDWRM
jgi:hypothetical protein